LWPVSAADTSTTIRAGGVLLVNIGLGLAIGSG
jgi:hypothetical protein